MNSYQVDREKWEKLSIFEQMGNIYSEVGRTFNAKKMHNSEGAEAAAIRALDLFDATAEALAVQKSPKLHEVLRVREIFVTEYSELTNTTLDSYFMQFAVAARLRQFT
jgi:hypothetical protein